jgi:nucleoside-diphosphate-sugar epimerase
VEPPRDIIAALRAAAPEGRQDLDEITIRRLRALTRSLLAASPAADGEYARFLAIARRVLALAPAAVTGWLAGKSVLVTGGTGCVGSALMAMLATHRITRLVSVARGATGGWPRVTGAEYRQADVRCLASLAAVVSEIRPDVVFHVAAQRDPGLAEREVHRTVTTNVLGTRNVIAAAELAGVAELVYASTGKTLRAYSPEVYTASKRAAEWLVAEAAARGGMTCSAARFTHIVDNSIIHRRLLGWSDGGVVRLHSDGIMFYAQSARESAQLLLSAGLGAQPGSLRVQAITDLGWPVSLLDLALGVLRRGGSDAPIYLSGYDPGYEDAPFPGWYDPRTAGDVSPLLSALEADSAGKAAGGAADSFPLEFAPDPELEKLLLALADVCEVPQGSGPVRAALDALSWALLAATARAAPAAVLARAAARAAAHQDRLTDSHRRILAVLERRAAGPLTARAGVSWAPGGALRW